MKEAEGKVDRLDRLEMDTYNFRGQIVELLECMEDYELT